MSDARKILLNVPCVKVQIVYSLVVRYHTFYLTCCITHPNKCPAFRHILLRVSWIAWRNIPSRNSLKLRFWMINDPCEKKCRKENSYTCVIPCHVRQEFSFSVCLTYFRCTCLTINVLRKNKGINHNIWEQHKLLVTESFYCK